MPEDAVHNHALTVDGQPTFQPEVARYDSPVDTKAVEPVAVVGVACRLPGANNPAEFWELLCAGNEAIRSVPESRRSGNTDDDSIRAGYLDRVDLFDAGFFHISSSEAAAIDPQQRLFLELAWEALENGNIPPDSLRGTSTAVYAAAIWDDYAELTHAQRQSGLTGYSFTGTRRSMMANRLSYFLGITGPSMTVDTGQSSSLVAVHLACEELRKGETSAAIVGGVNLILSDESTISTELLGALSPTGHCRPFDHLADGYVRGEGGATVVLKPLSRALADGDNVRAILRGSAINNDGGGDGLTVPHGRAQQDVLLRAYRNAGIDPSQVDYVELHGTGTPVGDPIEAAALGAVVSANRPTDVPVRVGSVKSNIGHLEGAAGIVGLLKVVLSLSHREIPASLNFANPHRDIDLDALHLQVQVDREALSQRDGALLAGVSSFGIGGTNAHVIVESGVSQAPPTYGDVGPAEGVPAAWAFSGRSAGALGAQAEAVGRIVRSKSVVDVVDVGDVLARGRAVFRHRAVVIGDNRQELLNGIDAMGSRTPGVNVVSGVGRADLRPVFVFPGQGAQWPGMGVTLAGAFPVFAEALRECAEALEPHVDWSLWEMLDSPLDRVDVVQPASWAVMVSLSRLWESLGVEPAAVVGHSQGEIAAAVVSGALSLDDAAYLVAGRSRVVGEKLAGRGGMLSLGVSLERARGLATEWPGLSVAAVNGPDAVVLSGSRDVLRECEMACHREDITARMLPVDYASHSEHVESVRDELLDVLGNVTPGHGRVPFYSAVEAGVVDGSLLGADYWYRNLRQPVRFHDVVSSLLAEGYNAFAEVSAHPVLTSAVQESAELAGVEAVVFGTLRRDDGGPRRFMQSAAQAHVSGIDVTWPQYIGQRRHIDLPTYPFQQRRYWIAPIQPLARDDGHAQRGDAELRADDDRHVDAPRHSVAVSPSRNDSTLADRLASKSDEERNHMVLDMVRSHAAVVLGRDADQKIGAEDTFREAGFDSPTAIELRNRLNAETGLQLASTVVFRYPTPEQLAEKLIVDLIGTRPRQATSVLDEFERLRRAIAGMKDDTERSEIANRLRDLLKDLEGSEARSKSNVAEPLESATDHEMFALIKEELGLE